MRNFLAKSEAETLTAPYDVASGEGALVGSLFGVAKVNIVQGQRGSFQLEGKVDLPKDGTAFVEGGKVYWDNTARRVTATANGNTLIGVATLARGAGSSTVPVRLNGAVAA